MDNEIKKLNNKINELDNKIKFLELNSKQIKKTTFDKNNYFLYRTLTVTNNEIIEITNDLNLSYPKIMLINGNRNVEYEILEQEAGKIKIKFYLTTVTSKTITLFIF